MPSATWACGIAFAPWPDRWQLRPDRGPQPLGSRRLGVAAILHGPRTANFAADLPGCDRAGAALALFAEALAAALAQDHRDGRLRAGRCQRPRAGSLAPLAANLLA
jgi:hypothetical protein